MAEETTTEVWRPDAEPWEALQQALLRAYGHLAYEDVEAAVKALSEMGWRLSPFPSSLGERIDELEAENNRLRIRTAPLEKYAEVKDRCAELEAENKRLRDASVPVPESTEDEPWLLLRDELVGELCGCDLEDAAGVTVEGEYARQIVDAALDRLPAGYLPGLPFSPVLEEPEGEEGRTPRRLTAVEEAIWGRYHGKHRDAGLLNKVNYLTRRVDALESAAPVPVEEPKRKRIMGRLGAYAEIEEADPAPAPEIKVGQLRIARSDGEEIKILSQVAAAPGNPRDEEWLIESLENGGVRPIRRWALEDNYEPLPDLAPSLNPEGLALSPDDRARLELIRDHDGNDLSDNDRALLTRLATPSEEQANER